MNAQYYQITLEELIFQYKEGFMGVTGLLFNYIKIKFAPGWKILLDPKKVIAELGISIHQFYRAIAKIKKRLPISFAKATRVVGEMPEEEVEKSVAENAKTVVNIATEVTKSAKKVATDAKDVTLNAKTEAENTSKINEQSDSPDLSSNIYSKFISNLSQGEREKFLDFCKKRTDSFDIPLKCSLNIFLAARNKKTDTPYFAEFWELYKKESDVALNPTNDKHNTGMKPDFQKWYYWLNQTGRMVRKYEKNGVVFVVDNCGQRRTFEEWLLNYSMEAAKKQFDAATRWGK